MLPLLALSAAAAFSPVTCSLPSLPVQVECRRMAVPEHRGDPRTRDISLFVAILRSPAKPPAADPVVFLQGGPGETALSEVPRLARSAILERRDIVVLEQRGTGRSRPELRCPEFERAAGRFFAPGIGYRRARIDGRLALTRCARRLRRDGIDLSAYTSADTAADIADLRDALGAEQVNLYGVSYGTRAALTTLRDHPEAVRSVVVDSGTGPEGADTRPSVLAANLRTGLDRYFDGRPRQLALLGRVQRAYGRAPLEARARVGGARRPVRVEFGGADVVVLIHQLLRSRDSIRSVPDVLAGLLARDERVVRSVVVTLLEAATVPGASVLGAQLSVDCGDAGPPTAADRRTLRHPGELSTFFLFASGGYCDVWGVPPAPPADLEPAVSDIPTLLFAGALDPISPPAVLRHSARSLSSATFVELAGEGHVPTAGRRDLDRAVAAFLDHPR